MNKIDKNAVLEQVKLASMAYPMRALSNDLDKAYSTLSNELDHRDYAKLGFMTGMSILEKSMSRNETSRTAALAAVDMIEAGLGRVAFLIPKPNGTPEDVLGLVANLSHEYAEIVAAIGDGLRDGKLDKKEIADCEKKGRALLKACLEMNAHFEELRG